MNLQLTFIENQPILEVAVHPQQPKAIYLFDRMFCKVMTGESRPERLTSTQWWIVLPSLFKNNWSLEGIRRPIVKISKFYMGAKKRDVFKFYEPVSNLRYPTVW